MWSVRPPTTNVLQLMAKMSTGVPSTVSPPGRVSKIAVDEVEYLVVEAGWQPGGVRVQAEDVEGGRLAAKQVVVDPVVPDQVIGAAAR